MELPVSGAANPGHGRPKTVEAVQKQVAELDYAPAFQMGHPKAFELAARLAAMLPSPLDHVFFTNSGSESVDTALKIALAYHRAKGNGTKVKLIGRERGYHGVGFGGISVGGISGNRKTFGNALSGIDHIRHTHDLARNSYTRGEPEYGVEFADDLEKVIALHDASNIAAVIVEPVAGSRRSQFRKGYLKRLRKICTKHDILLIFDEVITGFGRLGAPFAVDYFGVVPDLVTTAKGITSGVIPMGAVFASSDIYQAFMNGPENLIELFHGYTSGPSGRLRSGSRNARHLSRRLVNPRIGTVRLLGECSACAEGTAECIDIRNLGLIGAIELQPIDGAPTKRAFQAFLNAYEKGVLIRTTGDIIALSPPLTISKGQIDHLFDTLARCVEELGIGAGKCR